MSATPAARPDFPDDVAVTIGSAGYMSVIGIQNNGSLYQDVLPPGGSWTGWTSICGAGVTGVPAIVQASSGYHAFARRAADRAMMTCPEPSGSSWSSWSSLGGTWTAGPAVFTGAGGDVWLLAMGTHDVYQDTLSTSGTWSGWQDDGSDFTGDPGLSEDGSGIFHLFALSTGGALEVNAQEGGGHPWTGWTTLGSSFAGS